ncbi:MAG TPA: methionyl-tRNA formyltransferase [Thermoanaerobaculia bacterium]
MKLLFFGTPEFAVPSLAAVHAAGITPYAVVTQPDRPVGRHAQLRPAAVAAAASAMGIPVWKPEKVRQNAELLAQLRDAAPDVMAVVAYGRILPREILDLPRLGCVNVHASLLPRHRGASPIQAAILAGDAETGVATMRIVEELDAGPVYLERKVALEPGEDAGALSRRLAVLGGELLVETLRGLESGTLEARPQRGEPTFTRPIRREDGLVDWSLPAEQIARRLRAFTPWPGLHTFWEGERVKILAAEAIDGASGAPGSFRAASGALQVDTGEGILLVTRLQRAGKREVTGEEFARGILAGGRFDARPPA